METIESGKLFNALKGILNKLDSMFQNACKSLSEDDGIVCIDYKEDEDGTQHFKFAYYMDTGIAGKPVEKQFTLDAVPLKDDQGKVTGYDVTAKAKGTPDNIYKNVDIGDKVKFRKLIFDYLKKMGVKSEDSIVKNGDQNNGQNGGQNPAVASKQIKVKLKKVVSAKETSILLKSVMCGTEIVPADATSIITDLCNNDEFVDAMPENEDAYYCIDDADECVDANPCDSFETDSATLGVLQTLMSLMASAESSVNFAACNTQCPDTKRIAERASYSLSHLRQMLVEIYRRNDEDGIIPYYGYTTTSDDIALDTACLTLQDIYTTIDLYYPNFHHTDQSVLDNIQLEISDLARDMRKVSKL